MVMVFFTSCEDKDDINPNDPSNLNVVVTISDTNPALVVIHATADNTVEYQLRIGSSIEPVESNTSGYFEYTFIQPGNYQLDIRAYGLSGRFLREIKEVTINLEIDIPVEQGYITPLNYEGYTLMWNDEFEGSTISASNWVFETGTGCPQLCGWGNNELQYYRKENAWVEGGVLTIEARNENFMGSNYTSSRMKTQGNKSFMYGRVDIRALLPKGQGIWPALWMLGNDITSVGWPKCGEIDIMEMVGGSGREKTVHGTLHWDNNGHVQTGNSYSLQNGTFATEYHVFTIIWDESFVTWYVNDNKYYQVNITPDHMTEFHQEFFFIFNIAVGGNWLGNQDVTTVFPQKMKVDYIRVFQKQ
jgi:hypothetical protein